MKTENFKNIEKSFMSYIVGVEMERSEGNLWRALEGLQLCKIVKASQGTPDPGQGRSPEHSALSFLLF